ncbi:hypothetical protein P280DRAFT_367219, partial [Massarina eburnea CBS 473.64]
IHMTMKHVTLQEEPKFEALSYPWGIDKPENAILLDSLKELVRSLASAEVDHITSQTIWIDAVYIIQNDLDERSEQIKLMRKVYYQAEGVIVWLGE